MFRITQDGSKFKLQIWRKELQDWLTIGFYNSEAQAEAKAAEILVPEAK